MEFSGMTSQSISPGVQFAIIPASAIFWRMSAVRPSRKTSKNGPTAELKLTELLVLLLFFKPLLSFLDLRDLQNLRCTQARIHPHF